MTVNVSAEPSANSAEEADVIDGASSTVNVNDWFASDPMPLEALMPNA